jgi:hypothetical protein
MRRIAMVPGLVLLAFVACGKEDTLSTDSDTATDSDSTETDETDTGSTGGDSDTDTASPLTDGPCAQGTWGDIDPVGAVLIVDPARGGDDGNAGTVQEPLATIAEALRRGRATGDAYRVGVGAGEFTVNLGFAGGEPAATLQGCSPDETTLVAADGAAPVIVATNADLSVAGVTVRGGTRGVAAVGGTLVLDDVTVRDNARVGVAVDGTDARISDSRLDDNDAVGGHFGWGLVAVGSRVVIDGGEVDDNHGFGIVGLDGSSLDISGLEVSGTLSDGDGAFGRGIHIQDSDAVIATSTIAQNVDAGIFALRPLGLLVDHIIIDTTAGGIVGTGDDLVITNGLDTPATIAYNATVYASTFTNAARCGIIANGVGVFAARNDTTGNGWADGIGNSIWVQNAGAGVGSDPVVTLDTAYGLDNTDINAP